MTNTKRVVVYHPSNIVGGTEVLFSRCCLMLRDKYNLDVHVIDYQSGAITKLLGQRAGDFTFSADISSISDISPQTVMLVSARNILKFYAEVPSSLRNKDLRVLFWLLHPAELYAQLGIGYDRIKRSLGYRTLRALVHANPGAHEFKRVLRSLNGAGALRFMDKAVLSESQWVLSIELPNPSFLHLPTGLSSSVTLKAPASENQHLVIISRLDSFKVPGITKLLDDLSVAYSKNQWRGTLTIIGSGGALEDLVVIAEKLPYEVVFLGHLPVNELRSVLAQGRFSILLGMGMSLLEGASLGMPCIILPTSDSPIKDSRCYSALDSGNDSLGEYHHFPDYSLERFELSVLLQDIDKHWGKYSEAALLFFNRYYEDKKTAASLYHAIADSRPHKIFNVGLILRCINSVRQFRNR